LESLSREELIKMVRQMRNDQNTGEKKQLDAAKKEEHQESSNANQQDKAKEQMVRNMDEFKMAFLASQQKLEDLNAEMEKLNANYRKLFEVCNIWIKIKISNCHRRRRRQELKLQNKLHFQYVTNTK
jgi:phage-related minor tail protein